MPLLCKNTNRVHRFLWVNFQLLDIKDALSKEAVRSTLDNLPQTLSETYHRIIRRVQDGPGGKAKFEAMLNVFRWIAVARRPLRIEELEEAVSLESSDKYLHTDRIPKGAGLKLVSFCGNLATYHADDHTVSFAHHTVKQYILTPRAQDTSQHHLLDFESWENDVAHLCMTYLSFSDFQTQVAKVPVQVQLDPILTQAATWSSIPLGAQVKSALSWVSLKRGGVQRTAPMALAIPVTSAATDLLLKNYALLEYVIEYWSSHTSHIRSTSGQNRELFKHVALYLQLPFEFRPWNEQSHRSKTYSVLRNQALVPFDLTNSNGFETQICIFGWALKHAIGSLFGLLDRNLIINYLNCLRHMDSDSAAHIYDVLERFPHEAMEMTSMESRASSSWNSELLLELLRLSHDTLGSGLGFTESDPNTFIDLLFIEMDCWLDTGDWNELQVDTAVQALHRPDTTLSDHILKLIGDFSVAHFSVAHFSVAIIQQWKTNPSFRVLEEYLIQPGTGLLSKPDWESELMYLLERFYFQHDQLLWTSRSLPACTSNIEAGQAFVVVALALGKPLAHIAEIARIFRPNTYRATVFRPKGSLQGRRKFSGLKSYKRIRLCLGVDVFALVEILDNAASPLRAAVPIRGKGSSLILHFKMIVKIWQRYQKSFSIDILENDGMHLLRWAVHLWSTESVVALRPLYVGYFTNHERRRDLDSLLEFAFFASSEIRQVLHSL